MAATVRQDLDALWSDLKKADVDDNGDVDLKGLKVKITYGYNFDSWTEIPRVIESAFDPIARPLSSTAPIDRSCWGTKDRLAACSSMPVRDDQVVHITYELCRSIEPPSPFCLGPSLVVRYYPSKQVGLLSSKRFGAGMLYETVRSGTNGAYPHLTCLSYQPTHGRNNSILYGELDLLICAMRNRANQRKVDNEDEQEALFEEQAAERTLYPSGVKKYGSEFPDEKQFPVLMASFVLPHHGRLFYATMENDKLHIRQSDLYDFKKKSVAPLDLFGSILLSHPSGVPARIPTHTLEQNRD